MVANPRRNPAAAAPQSDPEEGRYAVVPGGGRGEGPGLDVLIHQPMRLAIVSTLAVNDRLAFNELKRLVGATDGNLSVHARKLEEAGYIRCEKSFADRVPRTEYALLPRGRRALRRYLKHMEALIRAVRESPDP